MCIFTCDIFAILSLEGTNLNNLPADPNEHGKRKMDVKKMTPVPMASLADQKEEGEFENKDDPEL